MADTKSELDKATEAAAAVWEHVLAHRERLAKEQLGPEIAAILRGIRDGLSDEALVQQLGTAQSRLYSQVDDSACRKILSALRKLVNRDA
jgi:hypothetical protein